MGPGEDIPKTSRTRAGIRAVTRLSRTWLPAVALACYALWCVLWLPQEEWRPGWDSGIYLLTGLSLAAGEGYRYLGEPFFLRPPGLPWLLSFLARDGSYDFALLNRLTMLVAASLPLSIFLALRRASGPWVALGVALLTGTSGLVARNFNWIMAEFPSLTLLFLAVACLDEAAARRSRWWTWALAGAALTAGSAYLRTASLVLLPGVLLLGIGPDRGWRRWRAALAAGVAGLLVLPWLLHSGAAASAAPRPSQQFLLYDYSTALLHVDPGDPASPYLAAEGWLLRIQRNGWPLARNLAKTLHLRGDAAPVIASVLILAGLVLATRRRSSLLEWVAISYALLIIVYIVHARRLAVPLVPFAYLYIFELLRPLGLWLSRWRAAPRLVGLPAAAAFAALFAANLAGLPAQLAAERWRGGVLGDSWQDIRSTAAWIREHTPEDAVLLCDGAPMLSVLSGRRAYSYRWARMEDPIAHYEPDYVVVDSKRGVEMEWLVRSHAATDWTLPTRSEGPPIRVYEISPR